MKLIVVNIVIILAGSYLLFRAFQGVSTGVMRPPDRVAAIIYRKKEPFRFWISVTIHAIGGSIFIIVGAGNLLPILIKMVH